MLDCGLRRGEVVKLCISDIDFVNHTMIINGKGSKQRVVPCGSVLSEQLKIYFDYRNSIIATQIINQTNKKQTILHNRKRKFF